MRTLAERSGDLADKLIDLWSKDPDGILMNNEIEKALQEQDKITKQVCAGSVAQIDYNYQAMGCGLEDQNITDRYYAMEHGWNDAIERSIEAIINTKSD